MWRIAFVLGLGIAGNAGALTLVREGLKRVLDDGERAQLSRPLSDLMDAVNAARKAKKQEPCTREGGDVERSVEVSPWGALPPAWRSIVLRCDSRKFQLKLSPEPASPQESELRDGAAGSRPGALTFAAAHRIAERGDGFVVLSSTFDDSRTTTLYVGEIAAFPPELPEKTVALLAVPKSAEFFDAAGGPIRDAIDVAAVLKVLRGIQQPPPALRAAEPKVPVLDDAARKREEKSIVALLAGHAGVTPQAMQLRLPVEFSNVVAGAAPDVFASVVDDFTAANFDAKSAPASTTQAGETPLISRAGFSRDGSEAMVFVNDGRATRFVILRRGAAAWRELYELPL